MENCAVGEFESQEFRSPEDTIALLETTKRDFFLENLEKKGIQFSPNASGFIENIGLFQKYIGLDILDIFDSSGIDIEIGKSFVVQKKGNTLTIFDGLTHTSLLIYNTDTKKIGEIDTKILNNPHDDSFLINFDMEFEDSLPVDCE